MNDTVEYLPKGGIFVPSGGVTHRADVYPERGFDLLRRMQERHFWYRGRARFILAALRRQLPKDSSLLRAIDLGCGCGGFGASLLGSQIRFAELALADSSAGALSVAGELAPGLPRYLVDLEKLGWKRRWDVAFLLDVIEHCPDDIAVLDQVRDALTPGGIVLVTVPALQRFWTWNDEVVGHRRRYSLADLENAAIRAGFRVLDRRYFMFFLSPLLWLSRLGRRPDPDTAWKLIARTHAVPARPVNAVLGWIFAAETPFGLLVHFPWGTSALAVMQKPMDAP